MCFIVTQHHQDKLSLAGSEVLIHQCVKLGSTKRLLEVHVPLVPISIESAHNMNVLLVQMTRKFGIHTCMFEFDCPCSMVLLSLSLLAKQQ